MTKPAGEYALEFLGIGRELLVADDDLRLSFRNWRATAQELGLIFTPASRLWVPYVTADSLEGGMNSVPKSAERNPGLPRSRSLLGAEGRWRQQMIALEMLGVYLQLAIGQHNGPLNNATEVVTTTAWGTPEESILVHRGDPRQIGIDLVMRADAKKGHRITLLEDELAALNGPDSPRELLTGVTMNLGSLVLAEGGPIAAALAQRVADEAPSLPQPNALLLRPISPVHARVRIDA